MNRQLLALFFYYAGFFWHEIERMYELIINAKSKKGDLLCVTASQFAYGGRRCNRRFMRRGRPLGNETF